MILSLIIFFFFFLFLLGMIFSKKTIYAVYFLIGIFVLYLYFCSVKCRISRCYLYNVIFRSYYGLYLFVVMFIGTKLIEDFGPSKKAFPIKFFFFLLFFSYF